MRIICCKREALACLLAFSLHEPSHAQDVQPKDLPARVRSIFIAKCSESHGRGLARPRAALYLHELRAVSSNPEWVVPYEPEKSYLWTLVCDDDMPAKGAKAGPLTAQEKEIVRSWIAAGSRAPPSQDTLRNDPPQASPGAQSMPDSAASLITHLFGWLGRFHLLVIHFPIALLAVAALGELVAAWRGSRRPESAVRFCVLLGATGAVAAAALGWLHADVGGHGGAAGATLTLHRWLGTSAGMCAIGVALASEWDNRRGKRSVLFRILVISGTALVGGAAHLGGLMVHGGDFFNW